MHPRETHMTVIPGEVDVESAYATVLSDCPEMVALEIGVRSLPCGIVFTSSKNGTDPSLPGILLSWEPRNQIENPLATQIYFSEYSGYSVIASNVNRYTITVVLMNEGVQQMEIARRVMHEDRDALKALSAVPDRQGEK